MDKIVYIVHCVDSEGPLYESLEATFERLHQIFGIYLEPTKLNLYKIQNKLLDLSGKEDDVADVFSNKRIQTLGDWNAIDDMLDVILTDEYRNKLQDSFREGWVYNWFCLDHAGFHGSNPRRRDAGYHNIFDHYQSKLQEHGCRDKDSVQFHFHPVPFCGDYNVCATAYVSNNMLFEILARKIIDRNFFPSCFRPGFHTERPDSHWFLEQWIPFDFANQSCDSGQGKYQRDVSYGRYGNWQGAPRDWFPYHPSHDDYRKIGYCHRWIARCLNMDARMRSLTQNEVERAFCRAEETGVALLSFTNHDFRDMRLEIENIQEFIRIAANKYPGVKFKYSRATDAMRDVLNLKQEKIGLQIDIANADGMFVLEAKSKCPIFGSQPFFACKTKEGNYYWDNMDFGKEKQWFYTFDDSTFPLECIDTVAVAANNAYGHTEICKLKL